MSTSSLSSSALRKRLATHLRASLPPPPLFSTPKPQAKRVQAMGFKPLMWYCQPEKNGAWATVVENAFGPYTPCGMESLVVCISHLALFGVCFYRIWRTKRDHTVQRYCLRSPYYNYLLGLLAVYCTAEPLFRMVMGFSVTNLDGYTGLAPFEVSAQVIWIFSSLPFCAVCRSIFYIYTSEIVSQVCIVSFLYLTNIKYNLLSVDRYVDRPLPGGTTKIGCRRSISAVDG
ncbi:hypothetical protein B296_00005322 [Ensete ventricosum]|uniref:Uncharacterized protein n=1 Tax=Ensete ventricosum TaxID=4639 RepID=A0A427AX02_ENSVE|nr:hypothetical protein B296_00005322 [Ensete ventricosum]